MKKKVIIGLVVLSLAGLIAFNVLGSKGKDQGLLVDTSPIEKGNIASYIRSTGSIVSMDKREVMSDVEEKIERMYVKKGDRVKAGQVLMTLDDSSLRNKIRESEIRLRIEEEGLRKIEDGDNLEEKISLDNLKIKERDLASEYARSQELFQAGGITKVEVDKAKDNLDQLRNDIILAQDKLSNNDKQSDIRVQKERIELAKIELSSLRQDLGKYTIKSPISGTIVDTQISESGIVEARRMLMSIQDVDNLEMVVNMNEYDVGKIKIGNPVEISGDSLQGKKYQGRVKHIANVAKASLSDDNQKLTGSENTIEIKIDVDKGSDSLKPGLSAKANILTADKKDVFVLPYESIFTSKDGSKSILLVENGLIKKLNIKTGIGDEFKVEVIGEIKPGEQVILNPTEDMTEGLKVNLGKEL